MSYHETIKKNKPVFASVTAGAINAKMTRNCAQTADTAMAAANAREETRCRNLLFITVTI